MRYNKYHTARWVAYRKWWRALHGMALRISHFFIQPRGYFFQFTIFQLVFLINFNKSGCIVFHRLLLIRTVTCRQFPNLTFAPRNTCYVKQQPHASSLSCHSSLSIQDTFSFCNYFLHFFRFFIVFFNVQFFSSFLLTIFDSGFILSPKLY